MAGLRHIVLLTFTDPTATDEVADALRAYGPTVPGCSRYDVGVDAGLAEGNAHVCVVADFDDPAAYRAYSADAEHQRIIAELIRPRLADRTAIQHPLP